MLSREVYEAYKTIKNAKPAGRWPRFKHRVAVRLLGSIRIDEWGAA